MAKFAIAKENVEKKLIAALGDDYITTQDKKIYVWADDGGTKVQIAISLTGVKNEVSADGAPAAPMAQTDDTPPWELPAKPTEITPPTAPSKEETETLEALLSKFGL